MIRRHRLYVGGPLALMVTAAVAYWLHAELDWQDLLVFMVSLVGFCVALLALYVAAATYTSIDSVNSISKMDGNILENEGYVTSVPELLGEFQCADALELQAALFASMERRLKGECRTAIQFADTLQHLIDLVVLFPAVFNAQSADQAAYDNRMAGIAERLDRLAREFREVSRGNAIQILENIKLFKGVVSYQRHVVAGQFNIHADLLHVRGSILRNPVTRTVFHNYLGLYYNKKAMHCITHALDVRQSHGGPDPLSIAGVRKICVRARHMPPDVREDVLLYLDSACAEFDRASAACGHDVMWPGFILYNKARTLFFLSVFRGVETEWEGVLDVAISARGRLNRLIDEILGGHSVCGVITPTTHLQAFFAHQEELARLVKLNLLLGRAEATAMDPEGLVYRGRPVRDVGRDNLAGAFYKIPAFPKIREFQDGLLEELY